jgi:hypothetical protein
LIKKPEAFMADEFLKLLADYTTLGTNYCANAKKLAPNVDYQRLISIYEAGLVGNLKGIEKVLGDKYSRMSDEEKTSLNELVQLSGMPDMVAKANTIIGADSISLSAVLSLAIDLLKKVQRFLQTSPVPVGGPAGMLFANKDIIIENIKKVIDWWTVGDKPKPPSDSSYVPAGIPEGIAPVTGSSTTQPPAK